jgi:hypothetical protein
LRDPARPSNLSVEDGMTSTESFHNQRERLRAVLYQLEAVGRGARHQELLQRAQTLIADIRLRRAAIDAARRANASERVS